jgi:hypothetical protein
MTTTTDLRWNRLLLDQLEDHWQHQLRPRLAGLTDDEYLWEPVPASWNVHVRDDGVSIDWEYPEPEPAPVTTIAWRLAHLIVGVFGARNASHFGGPGADYRTWTYAATAGAALAQLDQGYDRWVQGVRSLGEDGLAHPCGPAEGPWAEVPLAELVTHIHREVIHHGAEIALLRDLYPHRTDRKAR